MQDNPYAAPNTPSDNIQYKGEFTELTNIGAHRRGTSLICRIDFVSPPICLKSGKKVSPASEITTLSTRNAKVDVYLSDNVSKKLNWDVVPYGQLLSLSIFGPIALAMLTFNFIWLILIIPIVTYGCMSPKNNGIKLTYFANGLIEIHNAHSDFLRVFPEYDGSI